MLRVPFEYMSAVTVFAHIIKSEYSFSRYPNYTVGLAYKLEETGLIIL